MSYKSNIKHKAQENSKAIITTYECAFLWAFRFKTSSYNVTWEMTSALMWDSHGCMHTIYTSYDGLCVVSIVFKFIGNVLFLYLLNREIVIFELFSYLRYSSLWAAFQPAMSWKLGGARGTVLKLVCPVCGNVLYVRMYTYLHIYLPT